MKLELRKDSCGGFPAFYSEPCTDPPCDHPALHQEPVWSRDIAWKFGTVRGREGLVIAQRRLAWRPGVSAFVTDGIQKYVPLCDDHEHGLDLDGRRRNVCQHLVRVLIPCGTQWGTHFRKECRVVDTNINDRRNSPRSQVRAAMTKATTTMRKKTRRRRKRYVAHCLVLSNVAGDWRCMFFFPCAKWELSTDIRFPLFVSALPGNLWAYVSSGWTRAYRTCRMPKLVWMLRGSASLWRMPGACNRGQRLWGWRLCRRIVCWLSSE